MILLTTLRNLFKKGTTTKKNLPNSGFSMMELIVVIAIFAIITSVAMFDQGRLSSNILLTNMSYEVALAIREAQVYGIGVRSVEDSEFIGEYGAHFSIDMPRDIYVFGNNYTLNENPAYDPGEEKFHYQFQNQRGNRITAICVGDIDPAKGERCTDSLTNPFRVSWVDIVFKRPNPAPIVYANSEAGSGRVVGRVYIVVNNIDGDNCRAIVIESTGQIRVEDGKKTNPVCTNSN